MFTENKYLFVPARAHHKPCWQDEANKNSKLEAVSLQAGTSQMPQVTVSVKNTLDRRSVVFKRKCPAAGSYLNISPENGSVTIKNYMKQNDRALTVYCNENQ